MKRLFISINLPENVKNEIVQIIQRISASSPHLSALRWIPSENWHLTLIFLGGQLDEAFSGILQALKQTTQKYSNILENMRISFDKIIFAPPNKPPRMIWLTGNHETSKIIGEIQKDLENNLIDNGVRFQPENRPFNCHLTLARFGNLQITSENESISADINLKFELESIDLMESHLKRAGAEYDLLTKVAFTN